MKSVTTLVLATAVGAQAAVAPAVVSPGVQASISAGGGSFNPTFSADGRHLVFVSHANNLATNDDVGLSLDVFVRDLVSSNTVLVSVSTNGFGGANADANYPSTSSNGQFIVFASRASNLVPGDTNDASDVFLRNVVNGTTRLVSVDVNGNSPIDPEPAKNVPLSGHPQISGGGRWVFFESRATNLIATGAPLGSVNVYARDTWSNATVLVSADTNGLAVDGKCELDSITPDAHFAAFVTASTNIIAGTTNQGDSVYLRDLQSGQIVWATTNCFDCKGSVLSTSGDRIAYYQRQSGCDCAGVAWYDRQTGESGIGLGSASATNLSLPLLMSAEGEVILYTQMGYPSGAVVYEWRANRENGTNGVGGEAAVALSADGNFGVIRSDGNYPWQIQGTNHLVRGQLVRVTLTNYDGFGTGYQLVSLDTNAVAASASFEFSSVAISPDGSFVAFDSTATDLAGGDRNGASDIFLRDMNAGVTELITKAVSSKPATTAFAHSFLDVNSISANGRYVVTLRYDDPSALRDTNGWRDVYVSDLWSNISVAVSINASVWVTNDFGGSGPMVTFIENTNSFTTPIITADGTTVFAVRNAHLAGAARVVETASVNGAFASSGLGLSPAVRAPAGGLGNGNIFAPSASTDGQLLVFTTTATDLIDGLSDFNNAPDVILRERILLTNGLVTSTNHLISRSLSGTVASGSSSNGFLSPDGRWVIFESTAGDLVAGSPGGALALYARDWRSNMTYLVSVSPAGNPQWGYMPGSAVISGNSRYVAFSSGNIYLTVHDLVAHTSITAADPVARFPSLSHDGRYIAYVKRPANSPFDQVFARDLLAPQTSLVSGTLSGSDGNGMSAHPVISGDGRYVVFQSRASNLVASDENGATDVFVRDRILGVTMVVSANTPGLPGNGPSSRPIMAADGRTVVFQSFAHDLVTGDYNDKRDVFVLNLGGADTDGDGMDDDWEVAYFGSLTRSGTGDFDGDGANDRDEFLAGTDPTNSGSILRVLTVTPMGGGNTRLLWTGNPNRTYRAEFKDSLETATWASLNGPISWNGSAASIVDAGSENTARRFYRVVRLP